MSKIRILVVEDESLVARDIQDMLRSLRSIGEGIIAADGRGRIEFMNPLAENLTGWSQGVALEEISLQRDTPSTTPPSSMHASDCSRKRGFLWSDV
jgi:PAS domain-containing protein